MVQGVQRGQWVTQQEDGCKKESTLMDECLDDCLVGACGCQSIHRGNSGRISVGQKQMERFSLSLS